MVSDNLNSGHFGYTQIFYFYHASFYNANRYPFCRQWVGPYGLPFHQMLEKIIEIVFYYNLLLINHIKPLPLVVVQSIWLRRSINLQNQAFNNLSI
jgi:hypothetical protein